MKQFRLFSFALVTSLISPMAFSTSFDQKIGGGSPDGGDGQTNQFTATLTTLNGDVEGNTANGEATISIEDGNITVNLDMVGVPADMIHVQHIHAADSCPTIEADTNADGFIDVIEGIPSYGPILLNLDGDLTDHEAGQEGFPMADAAGSYLYTQSAPLNDVLSDLRETFRDDNDALARLEGPLNLEGRHFVVHGVSENVDLPDSVQSIGDIPNNATLPIACGEIVSGDGSGQADEQQGNE